MKFGIKTPPQHCSFDEMVDVWRTADALPVFESAWNFDHFYPLVGDPNGPCMEAWVTLSALAAVTRRIRVGCMVNGTPYRHPALVANMAATLDIVSGGRLELGLGAGWHEGEAAAYGIDLHHPLGRRMDHFEEAVEVIVGLLSQETTDFAGRFYTLQDARCEPKGPQRPHPPIVIGGGGEKRTLRTAARFAQHWNLPFAPASVFPVKKAVLHRHCEAIGRDPAEIRCSVQIALPPEQDPADSVAQASALGEAGADMVIFTLRPPYRASIVEPLARALEALA